MNKTDLLKTQSGLGFQGSRWEVTPSYLEVAAGPWGASRDFGVDVVGSWKAALDWHADHALNLVIANIPYGKTDYNYLGWPYHYILDLAAYPHHEDLFSDEFRQRNLAMLNEIFAYAKARGILTLVHHFNFMAPLRMAVAMGWLPRYLADEADWTDGFGGNPNRLKLLFHSCCWNVPSYQEFMQHCWREACRALPDVGGFLVTAGEGNSGHFEDVSTAPAMPHGRGGPTDHMLHWYNSDMRFVETSRHFIETFARTIREAGKFPVARAWSVEAAPHFMPKGVTYLIKHQLFDCIDAPGDPLIGRWMKEGHTMWVEACFIGENAGPVSWTSREQFQRIGEDIRQSGVQGAVSNFKERPLETPVNWLNFEMFHEGLKAPDKLADATPWVRRLEPLFGASAATAFDAMELISHGVLLLSKIAHRVGEGWSYAMWPTLTPRLDGMLNLGQWSGTPPPWWRGDLFTIKEYLDWLSSNPWEPGWTEKARGARRCPLQALEAAIADCERAEQMLEAIRPAASAPGMQAWRELRCSAAANRWQSAVLLEECRVKIGMAAARACIGYEQQKILARECLEAIAACERALAREREWVIQYPPDFGYIIELVKGLGEKYRTAVRQLQPFRRELQRFLDGQAWTLSRNELTWRAIAIEDAASQPPLRGDGVPLATRTIPWPEK